MEYGLTDIQEYYANTGALMRAAEDARRRRGREGKVGCSIVEYFGGEGSERTARPGGASPGAARPFDDADRTRAPALMTSAGPRACTRGRRPPLRLKTRRLV